LLFLAGATTGILVHPHILLLERLRLLLWLLLLLLRLLIVLISRTLATAGAPCSSSTAATWDEPYL
jgi:hypothetical protein